MNTLSFANYFWKCSACKTTNTHQKIYCKNCGAKRSKNEEPRKVYISEHE